MKNDVYIQQTDGESQKGTNGTNEPSRSSVVTTAQVEPTFKVIIDNGKPSETTANGEIELRAVLKRLYEESKKTDYAYFDIKVYDKYETDLSESQFITEIIGEIMNEGEKMKGRNLDYEKKFRAYLFKGDLERHKAICKNINVEFKKGDRLIKERGTK